MRPRTLDEIVGQQHLLAQGSPLRKLTENTGSNNIGPSSLILYGPPGTGKTTLAHVISQAPDRKFVELSAISSGVKEDRKSTRLNSNHVATSYAVFCLKKTITKLPCTHG